MKRAFSLILAFIFITAISTNVSAMLPYQSYTYPSIKYNGWRSTWALPAPEPYIPFGTIRGEDLTYTDADGVLRSVGIFKDAKDIFINERHAEAVYNEAVRNEALRIEAITKGQTEKLIEQGISIDPTPVEIERPPLYMYITDTGNNRIVIIDLETHEVIKVITKFWNENNVDTFNKPSGLFVAPTTGYLYICDTDNNRVVILDDRNNCVGLILRPQDEIFDESFVFYPEKIVVDTSNRVYVVARNAVEGTMCFDENGKFFCYFGTMKVRTNIYDWFWRAISTKRQRNAQIKYIPTEYKNIDLDKTGFIYAVNEDNQVVNDKNVHKLNPKGEDVIKNYTGFKLQGDLFNPTGAGGMVSMFVDVKALDKGIYRVLDASMMRVFTYDREGNLLYVFGGLGNQLGTFKKVVAIDEYDGIVYVLDQMRSQITLFKSTEYGDIINYAVALRFDGDETLATEQWEKVLKYNANYTLAYDGIGKSKLANKEYKEAMKYLRKANDSEFYSSAFQRYRIEVLDKITGYLLTGGAVLIVLFFLLRSKRFRRFIGSKFKKRSGSNV